ncbi:MAG: hypothetical protein WA880_03940 [Ornithinimicrobium sp.]
MAAADRSAYGLEPGWYKQGEFWIYPIGILIGMLLWWWTGNLFILVIAMAISVPLSLGYSQLKRNSRRGGDAT